MRKRDKLKSYEQANLMLEQSYLKFKGFLKESEGSKPEYAIGTWRGWINMEDTIDAIVKLQKEYNIKIKFVDFNGKEIQPYKEKTKKYSTELSGEYEINAETGWASSQFMLPNKQISGFFIDIPFEKILSDENYEYLKYQEAGEGDVIENKNPKKQLVNEMNSFLDENAANTYIYDLKAINYTPEFAQKMAKNADKHTGPYLD